MRIQSLNYASQSLKRNPATLRSQAGYPRDLVLIPGLQQLPSEAPWVAPGTVQGGLRNNTSALSRPTADRATVLPD